MSRGVRCVAHILHQQLPIPFSNDKVTPSTMLWRSSVRNALINTRRGAPASSLRILLHRTNRAQASQSSIVTAQCAPCMSTTSTSHDTASRRSNTIAFIGLGAMGREMASNLFTKSPNAQGSQPSLTLIVCDALPEAANAFARNFQQLHPGVQINVVDTPAEAAGLASVIITMLPSSPQVNQVYLSSESGILPGVLNVLSSSSSSARPEDLKTLAIDSTTLDVSTAKDVAQQVAKEAQIDMVDAPVSGGVVGAAAGSLSFMVGGPKSSFDLAKPFLEKMGKTIVHCGDSGTGLAVKICNNLILGINQVAVAEAMLLGTSLGLSPELLAGVINNSTGRCWPSAVNNPVPGALPGQSPPCERDFKGGFAAKLMLKDMNLALNAADSVGVPLPLGNSSVKLYEDVTKDQELAGRDFSVVFRHLQKLQERQQ